MQNEIDLTQDEDETETPTFRCLRCCTAKSLEEAFFSGCDCLYCAPCLQEYTATMLSAKCGAWKRQKPAEASQQPLTSPEVQQQTTGFEYATGDDVWYLLKDDQQRAATIVTIDHSVRPPSFGVKLHETGRVRDTEWHRLRPIVSRTSGGASRSSSAGNSSAASSSSSKWAAAQAMAAPLLCPTARCQQRLTDRELQELAPQAFQEWSEALSEMSLLLSGAIRCPNAGCSALIERLPPTSSQQQGPITPALDAAGNPVSAEAAQHRARHRYRCAACKADFCGECLAAPYHEGLTCAQARAPTCLYCPARLTTPPPAQPSALTVRELRKRIKAAGADAGWCVEKGELVAVYERAATTVCTGADCRTKLRQACSRRLSCGHWCGGVRGEENCLACLHQDCPSRVASSMLTAAGASSSSPSAAALPCGTDPCQFCWEELSTGPSLQLRCGHVAHLACCREQLKQGFPGPSISFNYMGCPMCGVGGGAAASSAGSASVNTSQLATSQPHMSHPALEADLRESLVLRDLVVQQARQQLKVENMQSDPALQPGGKYEGRPVDYALYVFTYYRCHKCRHPYYGGMRQCGAGGPAQQDGQPAAEWKAEELLCGTCAAETAGLSGRCRRHGTSFIEWKCQFCCSIAAWFCFGTTHMCDPCHNRAGRGPRVPCPGTARCPLGRPHPPPGQEHCLGCALCRSEARGGS